MAPLFKIVALLNLSLYVVADAATSPARRAVGTQFITGPCTSDADCGSSCCGFNSGKCAGPVVAQERDGGCGFGDAQPNDIAAQAITGGSGGAAPAPAATTKAAGTQFITGACTSDADCAAGCCGFKSGKCAGAAVAQERDGGCGFGDAQPNDNALQALNGGATNNNANANATAQAQGINATAQAQGINATAQAQGINATAQAQGTNATAQAQGTNATQEVAPVKPAAAPGTQFITGACTSDADCAAGCCAFNTGKCAGPVVAQQRDGGCGFGDAQPNDNAAKALQGRSLGKMGAVYM